MAASSNNFAPDVVQQLPKIDKNTSCRFDLRVFVRGVGMKVNKREHMFVWGKNTS